MRCDGMTSTTKEFREFLLKQNAFALAIGVIIGAAIGKVVSGIVEDVLMPVIGLVLPGGEWRAAQLTLSGQNAIKYGDLAGRVIDFFVIALVVFLIAKAFLESPPRRLRRRAARNAWKRSRRPRESAAPAPRP